MHQINIHTIFQVRTETKTKLKGKTFGDIASAAIVIQRWWRITRKVEDPLPDLNDKEIQNAAAKIQASFKGFQTRKKLKMSDSASVGNTIQDLPDLNDKDIQNAALKIQAAYKGFQVRSTLKKHIEDSDSDSDSSTEENDSLPDLEAQEVLDAPVMIQKTFKGFKARKELKAFKDDLPDLNDKDIQNAALKIQAAFKGFQVRSSLKKANEDSDSLPDLDAQEVLDAAVMIQKTFKGFKARKELKAVKEDLPDLNHKDIQKAAIKIQAAFKGFQVRSSLKKDTDDLESLPDLDAQEVLDAAVMIQKTFKGFKARKELKAVKEDLPDLNDKDVQAAAIMIQSAFRGFNTRKEMKDKCIQDEENDDLPDLCDADTLAAALKIQSAFKGYKVRKVHKVPMTPQPSIDFENIPPSDISGPLFSAKRVPPVPARFDSKQMQINTSSTSNSVPNITGGLESPKSPLPARSKRLKEVAIPKIPQNLDDSSSSASSTNQFSHSSSSGTPSQSTEPVSFIQQTLLRKESIQNFFKKQGDIQSPESPQEKERGRERSFTKTLKDASETIRSRSKSKEREKKPFSLPAKTKEDQKSKIGGFFSSMFKKADKPKVQTPSPDILSPDMKSITNVEFKFNEQNTDRQPQNSIKSDDITKEKIRHRKESSSDTESNGSPTIRSRQSSGEDILNVEKKPKISKEEESQKINTNEKKMEQIKSKSSGNAPVKPQRANGRPEIGNGSQDEDLKKDLIHVVLTAVEENWLNQAPKPTLDKVKALLAQDSDPELENSERSTSEADYMKKKTKAQKSQDLQSDDEGAQLCKQDSADGEFPYIETTLPQERSGTVTITPANQRVSECKLTSIDRPRSLSPRKPGKLEEYVQEQSNPKIAREDSRSKITVKLPRQESKGKILKSNTDNESWQHFSAAGLQSPKPNRKSTTKTITGVDAKKDSKVKKDWVDCEKLPETKKSIKRYGTEPGKRKSTGGSDVSLQTPSGTQIVSPEECSCDCHHDTPPRILSPTASDAGKTLTGTKPKTNPRTSSVTARTKPIPSLKSKESLTLIKSASSKVSTSISGTLKKSSQPPPVPVRTTSVVSSKLR